MTTTTKQYEMLAMAAFELSANDQEELAYNTIGYELDAAMDPNRIVLWGEQTELKRWLEERWLPLAKTKGWYSRLMVWKGKMLDYGS